jgi:hypothetical protein
MRSGLGTGLSKKVQIMPEIVYWQAQAATNYIAK